MFYTTSVHICILRAAKLELSYYRVVRIACCSIDPLLTYVLFWLRLVQQPMIARRLRNEFHDVRLSGLTVLIVGL